MILALHIAIALASLALATLAFFSPSKTSLRFSWMFVFLTIISGTYLVAYANAPILKTCISGLLYTMAVSSGLVAAHRKLALAKKRVQS